MCIRHYLIQEAVADYCQVLEEYFRPFARPKGCPGFASPPRYRWVCTLAVCVVLRTPLISAVDYLVILGCFSPCNTCRCPMRQC